MKKIGQSAKRQLLENFLNMAPDLTLDRSKVKMLTNLTFNSLNMLFNEKHSAVYVPKYCDPKVALKAGKIILAHQKVKNFSLPTKKGIVETDVNYGLGFPKRLGLSNAKNQKKYYREALGSIQKMRAAFAPNLSPIDRLRLELDELWPAGASIGHSNGQTELAGTVRHMNPIENGIIHIDDPRKSSEHRVFSACFYLKIPNTGGELEIWNANLGIEHRQNPLFKACHNLYDQDTQHILRKRLPPPLKIKVTEGSLAIFDTARPHAVAGFKSGYRLAVQFFVVWTGNDKPLKIFS